MIKWEISNLIRQILRSLVSENSWSNIILIVMITVYLCLSITWYFNFEILCFSDVKFKYFLNIEWIWRDGGKNRVRNINSWLRDLSPWIRDFNLWLRNIRYGIGSSIPDFRISISGIDILIPRFGILILDCGTWISDL